MDSLLNLVKRMNAHEPQDFVAPLPQVNGVTMSVLQDGLPYRFKVVPPPNPDWWVVRPHRHLKGRADPIRLATPLEVIEYLNALPKRSVIVLFRLDDQTWACSPAFPNAERQRGWTDGLRPLRLIREIVQPLDIVRARDMAGTLLYDEIDLRTPQYAYRWAQDNLLAENRLPSLGMPEMVRSNGGLHSALQVLVAQYEEQRRQAEEEARRIEAEHRAELARLAKADRERRLAELRNNLGARIEDSLTFMGAQLVGWNEEGNNIRVRWSYHGHTTTTVVNRDMQVQVAGFCLAGTDRSHSLTSIVQVMEEARVAGRIDGVMHDYNPARSRKTPLQFVTGEGPSDEWDED